MEGLKEAGSLKRVMAALGAPTSIKDAGGPGAGSASVGDMIADADSEGVGLGKPRISSGSAGWGCPWAYELWDHSRVVGEIGFTVAIFGGQGGVGDLKVFVL